MSDMMIDPNDTYTGEERRKTCAIHTKTIQCILEKIDKMVTWKVFVLIVGLAVAIIGASNLILTDSVKDLKKEISENISGMEKDVKESNQILHRRISDNADERLKSIDRVSTIMNSIDVKLGVLDYRINQVEKKLDNQPGKNGGKQKP